MTDRVVNVRLNLDHSAYRRNAAQAEQDTRRMARTASAAAAEQEQAAQRAAAASQGAFARARTAATEWASSVRASAASGARSLVTAAERGEEAFRATRTAGLLLLGVFAAASVTAAKFEKAMSGVAAVADTTAAGMTQLRNAALQAGRTTAYTASQAADAEAELARAGVQVADIVGGALTGALSLAAAGQLDLAEAAVVTAQAMNTFGLKGKDTSHIADVLAAGANKSAADVHGLGESLRMGGLLAKQTGLSLEDTVGVLSAFADRALIGSDAGTSLKVMLQRLTPQSDEAAGMMEKLGLSAYDSQGQFVGLTELAGRMQRSFSQLTPEARNAAMGVIFGSDAVRSATILYELGSAGVDRYRRSVDDSGAAAEMAKIQMNNLAGDLEHLKGALEVALIQSGSEANKVLREMVQIVTGVVNAYSSLPGWAQSTAVGLMGVVGALALAAGGFMLILPRIAAFQASLATLSTTMPRLTAAASRTMSFLGGPWGIALGIAVAALGAFGAASGSAKKQQEELTQAVKADGAAVGANTRAWVAHELETRGVLKAAEALKISTSDLTEAILGNGAAADRVRGQLKPFNDELKKFMDSSKPKSKDEMDRAAAIASVSGALDSLSTSTEGAVGAAKREAEASGAAAESTTKLGTSAATTADQIQDTRTEAEKLSDALDNLNGKNIGATQAAIGFQKGLAELRDTVKENGTALDITTEKGREVKEAILGAAAAAQSHAEAVMKQTNSSEEAQIVLARDVEALKATMKQAGFTQAQIESLTAAYARVPEHKATEVTDPGALQTIADLQEVKKRVEDVPPGKSITVRAPSAAAIQDLEAIGYKVETLPDGQVKVTVPTNDAFDGASKIQRIIDSIDDRIVHVSVRTTLDGEYQHGFANGGIVRAAEGYTVPGYAPRRDVVPALLSPGEGVLVPETVRRLGGAGAIDALNAWGRYGTPIGGRMIPARQLGGGSTSTDNSRSTTVHLHGATQSGQEQLADLMRHLAFVG